MIGYAHSYDRDHINTDEIIPARYLNMDTEKDLAKHAMEDIDMDFITKVKEGDFMIAGEDFGCGSSREHAVWALRGSGIRCVIADSFARIFYRNCLNNGFLALECKGISKHIKKGDKLRIDLQESIIENLTSQKEYKFMPTPEFAKEMINAGGLLNFIGK